VKRRDPQRSREDARRRGRWRDAGIFCGSVAVHLTALLLLPGFTPGQPPPSELYLQLVQGQAGAMSGTLAPPHAVSGGAKSAPPGFTQAAAPANQAPAEPRLVAAKPPKPTVASAAPPRPSKPAAKPAASRQSNQATDVVEPAPVIAAPPRAQPAKPEQPTPPPAEPAPAPKEQPLPKGAEQPGPATAPPSPPAAPSGAQPAAPGGSSGGAAPGGGGQSQGDGGSAGPPPPPPPPPGPSPHELDLLKAWGDKARKRIRSQGRNSEEGARGTVRFEFDVSRRGRLLDVRLTKSSGYNNLDNDALEATRAAFNEAWEIVPFPDDVSVDKWTFPMDLTYPLY